MNHSLPYKLDGIVTDSDGEPNVIWFAVMFFVLLSGLLSDLFSVFVAEFVSVFFDVFGCFWVFFRNRFQFYTYELFGEKDWFGGNILYLFVKLKFVLLIKFADRNNKGKVSYTYE